MKTQTIFLIVLLLASLTSAQTKLRFSAFFGKHFYGNQVKASDWELDKLGDGFGMMGFGGYAQLSNAFINAGAFNTSMGLAYDTRIGLNWSSFGIYYGKFGALDKDIKKDILTPQYVGLSSTWSFGRTALQMDVQYGFGDITISRPGGIGYMYQDESVRYSMLTITPQVSYRILKHFYAFAALGSANYSFSEGTDITFNTGFMVGDLFCRVLSAPREILRRTPDPTLIKKPNIYLYPETSTNVSVRIFPNGSITTSIPEYNNGWEVTTWPDGHINGTPGYLFYEAEIPLYAPASGWCVKTENLQSFFEELLPAYGLNDREIEDFLDYWLSELQAAPYYTISPLLNSQVEDLCPLFISPTPDQILRLWFIFQPQKSFVEKKPPLVQALNRSGFVVVEWGGAIVE